MTFDKAFNDIYKDALSEYGFKYITKYGLHVKLINNELLYYICFYKLPYLTKGKKCFTVLSGIVSMYCSSIDKEQLQMLGVQLSYYTEYTKERRFISGFQYDKEDMNDVIKFSLEKTIEIVLPIFNEVTDLNSYINYKKNYGLIAISGAKKFWADSLALIKANNHDDFQELFERAIEYTKKALEAGEIGGTFQEQYDLLYDGIIVSIPKSRDIVYNDPELYKKAIEEADRRKEKNLEFLRGYKLI